MCANLPMVRLAWYSSGTSPTFTILREVEDTFVNWSGPRADTCTRLSRDNGSFSARGRGPSLDRPSAHAHLQFPCSCPPCLGGEQGSNLSWLVHQVGVRAVIPKPRNFLPFEEFHTAHLCPKLHIFFTLSQTNNKFTAHSSLVGED